MEKQASKHCVEPYEVEEVFREQPRFRFVENGLRAGEDVYAALGPTEKGRYLITFFILKADGRALPLSARDMTPAENKCYGRK